MECFNYYDKARMYCEEIRKNYYKLNNSEADLKKMYSFIKEIIPEFYIENEMHRAYNLIIREEILRCEEKVPKKYIIESSPIFNIKEENSINNCYSKEGIINFLVFQTRKHLVLEHSWDKEHPININNYDFTNDCVDASKKLKESCDSLNIESYILRIHPGYDERANLYNGSGFHYCNVVKVESKYYLIDCTYRQFFTLNRNCLDRIGIVNLSGCNVGTFMLMTDSRKQLANKILKDGWVELDEDVLKNYLDGFTLSFRNGLYYEQTKDFSYTTDYTVQNYINFLNGQDNQINHESKEVLGYQRKPLKNYTVK